MKNSSPLEDKVNEFVATLDTVSYIKETPRGWVVCGTKNNKAIVKEIKDYL
jgi:hypothetical protein